MSDAQTMTAQNAIISREDFEIKIFTVDDDGHPILELKEFETTVTSWEYALAPDPFEDEEGDDVEFDDLESDGSIDLSSDEEDEENGEDEDADLEEDDLTGEEGMDVSFEPYRELRLIHHMTGVAFQEMMRNVYRKKRPPAISVAITYFAKVGDARTPIFRHLFLGDFYMRDELSGHRGSAVVSQSQPLELTTCMDVFGSETYVDPTDTEDVMSRLWQDYAARQVH